MNQKHRVIKPFASIESFKVAPGNLVGGQKSSIPMLPPANARLNPDTILLQRRGSESSGSGNGASNAIISMPMPRSNKEKDRNSINSGIIFTGAGSNSGNTAAVVGTKGQVNSLNSNDKVLLRKISELETQNERLRQDVEKAQSTIQSYRGFMANHPGGDRAGNAPSKSIAHAGCQTVVDGSSVDALQDKLADAHRRMHSLQQAQAQAGLGRHEAQSSVSSKTSPRPVALDDSAAVQTLQQTVAMLEKRNAEHKAKEVEMQQQLLDAERVSRLHSNSKEENLLLLKQLNDMQSAASSSAAAGHATLQSHAEAVSGLCTAHADQRAAVQQQLRHYGAYISETVLPQMAAVTAALEQKDTENTALQHTLTNRETHIQTLKLRVGDLQECVAEEKRMHAELRVIYESLEASVLAKQDTATVTAHAVAEVLANAAKPAPALPSSPDKELRRQLTQYELLIEQLESKHKSASQEREKHFLRAQHLSTQLATGSKQLDTLCEAHAEVVKTVKHSAHVKDLQRVVAARELTLDKDRAEGEVGHIKEVNNVLSFCLNTVETTLLETNPQVVIRVADGRTRRLQFLEQCRRRRSKDIEQRSVETISLGATALEGFQKKADDKAARAEADWLTQLDAVRVALKAQA